MPPAGHAVLPASLDLPQADALFRAVSAALAEGGLMLDGAAVERVSTPCLQILAAAAAAAASRGQAFRLHHASDVLRSAIDDLGLRHAIPLGE